MYEKRLILFGVILLVIGLMSSYYITEIVNGVMNVLPIAQTKGIQEPVYGRYIKAAVKVVSFCSDFAGILVIIYGVTSKSRRRS